MVNVAPIVAATAALNAASSALNANRVLNKGKRAPTEEEIKKNQEYRENEQALSEDYAKAYKSACMGCKKSEVRLQAQGGRKNAGKPNA